jgi:hypothetical protein
VRQLVPVRVDEDSVKSLFPSLSLSGLSALAPVKSVASVSDFACRKGERGRAKASAVVREVSVSLQCVADCVARATLFPGEYAMSSLAVKNAWRALDLSDPPLVTLDDSLSDLAEKNVVYGRPAPVGPGCLDGSAAGLLCQRDLVLPIQLCGRVQQPPMVKLW